MNPTEETKTLPPEIQPWVRLVRLIWKYLPLALPILATTIGSSVAAYRSAAGDAAARAQEVKDKSEAGYQVTKEAMQAQEKRIAELEATVRQLSGQQHPAARKGSKPRGLPAPQAPAPPLPAAPKALPHDLDQAQRQIYRGAPPAPAPDGGTRKGE